jgi:hypothetical protein
VGGGDGVNRQGDSWKFSEIGSADRQFSNASNVHNINANSYVDKSWNPIASHSALHTNPDLIKRFAALVILLRNK